MYYQKLKEIAKNAYTPYSHFNIGSIVVFEDGSEFSGVNVENISFGATNCAERSAIFNGISNGKKDLKIKEIHLYSEGEFENQNEFVMPCGICRQVISEFSNSNTKLFTWGKNGESKEFNFESEININSFSKK